MRDQQEKFIQGLIKGLSQRQAYKRAYPKCRASDKTIDEMASKLYHNPKVYARYQELHEPFVEKLVKECEKEFIVSKKDVLRELVKIGFANVTDFVTTDGTTVRIQPTDQIEETKLGAIAGIKEGANGIELKMYDKTRALELIGKHLGMFSDKTEISGDLGLNIVVDYGDCDDTG